MRKRPIRFSLSFMTLISQNCENKKFSPTARMESKKQFAARQARLDMKYPNRHVMSTLRNYRLYAVSIDGSLVSLGGVANYNEMGATMMALNRVKTMTKLARSLKNITQHPKIVVQEYIADVDAR